MNVTSPVRFAVNATDPDGDALSYSASGLPVNSSFDPVNRTFTWAPYTSQAGNYTVIFNVTDGRLFDTENVLIRVTAGNRAPVLDPIGNRTVNVTSPVRFAVNATDPDGDALSYSASGLPVNSSLIPLTGPSSWTPADDQAGVYKVTFKVHDEGLQDNESIWITVNENSHAPVSGQSQMPPSTREK